MSNHEFVISEKTLYSRPVCLFHFDVILCCRDTKTCMSCFWRLSRTTNVSPSRCPRTKCALIRRVFKSILQQAKRNTLISQSHRLIMPEVLMKTEPRQHVTTLEGRGESTSIFLFSKTSRPALGPNQHLTQRVLETLSQSVREAHHSPPSNAKVKNVWNYTSTPPHAFTACTWTAVLLPRTFPY
jgi:hypothetical protein